MASTSRPRIRRVALSVIATLALAAASTLHAAAGTVETSRISVRAAGAEASGDSFDSSISANGRFVAFESDATNLVSGDTNGDYDVFVRDRRTGTTRRVSVSSDETQGSGESDRASISADGRFVAFTSESTNLVVGDTNGDSDIFVRDRETGRTRRVSVSSDGVESDGTSFAPSISADGRYVAFVFGGSNLVGGDLNAAYDIFVRDRETARTRRVSVSSAGIESNGNSFSPSISAHGRYVAFQSGGSNLVIGDLNAVDDIFVRDREAATTSRVNVSSTGTEGDGTSSDPSISANGRFLAFRSYGSNLVGGEDTNNYADIFLHDRQTGATSRASVDSAGTTQGNADCLRPAISADARFIVFDTEASSLIVGDSNGQTDVFVRGPLR